MKKLRLLGLFAAAGMLLLQSCKKNETTLIKPIAKLNSKKDVKWNPGDAIVNARYMMAQFQEPLRAVSVVGPSTADGGKIHRWDYVNQAPDQQWNIVKRSTVSGTDYFTLSNVNSNKVLTVPTGGVSGTQLEQWTYAAGNDRQLWSIKHVIYGVYLVVNKATNMAMTQVTTPTLNGDKVTQTSQTWPGNDAQHFFFTNLNEFFFNPLRGQGPDPWVTYRNGFYYYLATTGGDLTIIKTTKMSDLHSAWPTTIWTPPPGTDHSTDIWAPELWYLDGKWYIYFAATDPAHTHANRRMFVLESSNPDPTVASSWVYKGKISTTDNQLAIDGTVFLSNNPLNTDRFFVWAGDNMIHIAKMSNPWTLIGARSTILTATLPWETQDPGRGLEAPQILHSGSKVFIIYSAGNCGINYQLGQAQLIYPNCLLAGSWQKKSTAVFVGNPINGVFAPGHCSFFNSNGENWLLYHAKDVNDGQCDAARNPRMQKFTFNGADEPDFGTPQSKFTPLRRPLGE